MCIRDSANPLHLQNWWGPEGFTNTFHEFDLKPEGRWILTCLLYTSRCV